ncbi:V-type ATP synthase subunit E [Chlamydiifrater phoenicopteri]|uniref:V-type ATP synthase subunit E n=1 Tax=Chlamydiifrater phoenicopteri TaxID=2681469 RepID=UPI001BCBC79F|nr:V-type ATP synthase subunit E [Chlamydiifrater phoenicopteri]
MGESHSDEKLKRICDALRTETLEPAEKEAASIIEGAKGQASAIIEEANRKAESLLAEAESKARDKIAKAEKALCQAGKRSLEALRHAVEEKFFKANLSEWLSSVLSSEKVVADLITALVGAVDAEGVKGPLVGYISKKLTPRSVNELLGKTITEKFKGKSVTLGDFQGGVQLKVNDRHWILDLSSEALQELFVRYLQKDFREMIFADSMSDDFSS